MNMAIYHMSLKASSSNSASHFSYISASGKYESKSDLVRAESFNMPNCEPSEFWSECEKSERSNANLYKEFELSLPREFDFDQCAQLIREFRLAMVKDQPCTVAMHSGRNGDNPHVHMMFSMRANDGVEREQLSQFFKRANAKHPERGGAPKLDEWRGKDFIVQARKTWETMVNKALDNAGINQQVDCRSLKDQGIIDRLPQPKIGYAAQSIVERGDIVSTRYRAFQIVQAQNKASASTRFTPMRSAITSATVELRELKQSPPKLAKLPSVREFTRNNLAAVGLRGVERELKKEHAKFDKLHPVMKLLSYPAHAFRVAKLDVEHVLAARNFNAEQPALAKAYDDVVLPRQARNERLIARYESELSKAETRLKTSTLNFKREFKFKYNSRLLEPVFKMRASVDAEARKIEQERAERFESADMHLEAKKPVVVDYTAPELEYDSGPSMGM